MVTRSEETHASAAHDGDTEEQDEEENPPPKGKRVASKDAEAGMQAEGSKRSRSTSARAAGELLERVELSDESEDDPLAMGRKNPTPRGFFHHFYTSCSNKSL